MKKFKYTFSKLIIALFIVGMVIAAASIALNIVRLSKNIQGGFEVSGYDWFILILVIALSLFFIAVATSCMISSYYVVENKSIVLRWGFIKNKIDLNEVKEMKYYPEKDRLELVFSDDSFFIVSTRKEWVNEFVDLVKTEIPKIPFIQDSVSD